MEKHGCSERVWEDFHNYACSRSGKLNEDGKWWCKQHAPSTRAAKRAQSEAKWDAKRRADDAISKRCQRIAKELGVEVCAHHLGYPNGFSDTHAIVPLEWLERMAKERNP